MTVISQRRWPLFNACNELSMQMIFVFFVYTKRDMKYVPTDSKKYCRHTLRVWLPIGKLFAKNLQMSTHVISYWYHCHLTFNSAHCKGQNHNESEKAVKHFYTNYHSVIWYLLYIKQLQEQCNKNISLNCGEFNLKIFLHH